MASKIKFEINYRVKLFNDQKLKVPRGRVFGALEGGDFFFLDFERPNKLLDAVVVYKFEILKFNFIQFYWTKNKTANRLHSKNVYCKFWKKQFEMNLKKYRADSSAFDMMEYATGFPCKSADVDVRGGVLIS